MLQEKKEQIQKLQQEVAVHLKELGTLDETLIRVKTDVQKSQRELMILLGELNKTEKVISRVRNESNELCIKLEEELNAH